ncbi:MAG: DUF5989 family protein [Planctomycetota bacterium]
MNTTDTNTGDTARPPADKSVEQLADERDPGIVAEFVDFLTHHKKWWLTPIVLVLLLLGVLLVLGSTGAAPFIYTLF